LSSYHVALGQQRGTVVSGKWSIVLTLHCSYLFAHLASIDCAACSHVMHALDGPTSGVLQMCVHWEHAFLTAQAGLLGSFLCLKLTTHRKPRDTWQCQSPPQLGGEVRSHRTHDNTRAHLGREVRSEAIEQVPVPEPTSAERCGPEPWDTWQRQSSPQPGDEVQSHRTVAALELTSVGRHGPEP
jgi:hypothetical protein